MESAARPPTPTRPHKGGGGALDRLAIRSARSPRHDRRQEYLPRPGYAPPPPQWKSRDYIRGVLPEGDPHRDAVREMPVAID